MTRRNTGGRNTDFSSPSNTKSDMTFTAGAKVYVSYVTDIAGPTVKWLTIREFKNNLLYFREKSSYYAVECYSASFYGYSRTLAGKVLITKHRWQLPFAALAEKIAIMKPAKRTKKKVVQTFAEKPELAHIL